MNPEEIHRIASEVVKRAFLAVFGPVCILAGILGIMLVIDAQVSRWFLPVYILGMGAGVFFICRAVRTKP